MPNVGKETLGTSQLDVEFTGNQKYRDRACQNLEVIAEAVEVIYAFAVDLEPAEVRATMTLHGHCHVPFHPRPPPTHGDFFPW
jgi:hypothetical protein